MSRFSPRPGVRTVPTGGAAAVSPSIAMGREREVRQQEVGLRERALGVQETGLQQQLEASRAQQALNARTLDVQERQNRQVSEDRQAELQIMRESNQALADYRKVQNELLGSRLELEERGIGLQEQEATRAQRRFEREIGLRETAQAMQQTQSRLLFFMQLKAQANQRLTASQQVAVDQAYEQVAERYDQLRTMLQARIATTENLSYGNIRLEPIPQDILDVEQPKWEKERRELVTGSVERQFLTGDEWSKYEELLKEGRDPYDALAEASPRALQMAEQAARGRIRERGDEFFMGVRQEHGLSTERQESFDQKFRRAMTETAGGATPEDAFTKAVSHWWGNSTGMQDVLENVVEASKGRSGIPDGSLKHSAYDLFQALVVLRKIAADSKDRTVGRIAGRAAQSLLSYEDARGRKAVYTAYKVYRGMSEGHLLAKVRTHVRKMAAQVPPENRQALTQALMAYGTARDEDEQSAFWDKISTLFPVVLKDYGLATKKMIDAKSVDPDNILGTADLAAYMFGD